MWEQADEIISPAQLIYDTAVYDHFLCTDICPRPAFKHNCVVNVVITIV